MLPRSVRLALAIVPCVLLPGLGGTKTFAHFAGGASCGRALPHDVVAVSPPKPVEDPIVVAHEAPSSDGPTVAVAVAPPDPRERLREFLRSSMPDGGEIVEAAAGDGPELSVVHVARAGDTLSKIAAAYIDMTTCYTTKELANAMLRANPKLSGAIPAGTRVVLPRLVKEAPKPPAEARLGWPEDKSLRGIYANATYAGSADLPAALDEMAARGMNAIVVDAKDVSGFFTYPSKIPLAVEVDANKHATVPSFARLVRVAHARGIRVLARVSCFRDEWIGPRRHDLAVAGKWGGPHRASNKIVDWLDPANETVQTYLLAVVQEAIDAGVDEIQLDYVRYPTEGIWDADFKLKERGLTTVGVITGFVKRVHEVTQKANVPLSLDVFGVVAWRFKVDTDATGQDLVELAPNVEALSPMVYPSHFADGFNGYEIPGDHADIVAIGTKRAVNVVKDAGSTAVVRPWVQAFPWKSPHFGSPYIADQIKEAKNGGGVGYLAWNSGGEYGATFQAVPRAKSH